MKRLPIILLLALASPVLWATAAGPAVIPLPAVVRPASGSFVVTARTPLTVRPGDQAAARAARFLAGWLAGRDGIRIPVSDAQPRAGAIHFATTTDAPGGEGYRLRIDPRGVTVEAREPAGLFYGAVTLWQMIDAAGTPGRLDAMVIEDRPRFAWRGLLLDSARHMQSPAQIRTLLDQMALHKLNVLHWHLTDDQGWRLEIRRYPLLTRIGAWRTPPDAGHDGEPERYGGFYTQAQVRALVRYAAARHITIVPEIDLPGHAQAAVAAYPRVGVTGRRLPVSVDWGVHTTLYNPDPATVRFLENVLDEVMEMFPSRIIHLGGDEAVKDQWQASPAVQARMRELGLKDADALQGWMMGQLGAYLAAHGRRMAGWDEILAGGVPADAVVMSWRGAQGAVEAARQGHDVILSPAPALYFDQLQSDRADETTGRVPVESLADVYRFEPVPAALDPRQAAHVLGAQANVWTEHMPSMAHLEHAVFPRLDALAEVLWTPRSRRDWAGFLVRLPAQLARYRRAGIAFADSAFAPAIGFDEAAARRGASTVTLSSQARFGTLRYTLDGSEPTARSRVYRGPFPVNVPATVRARAFDADGRPLSAARTQAITGEAWRTRSGDRLVNCPGSAFRLRVQPLPDVTTLHPVYTVTLFDACQQWPAAPTHGIGALEVTLARVPRNYQLAHEADQVVHHPPRTAYGELVLRDGCAGPELARVPLPDPARAPRRFTLRARVPRLAGPHDLCLIVTGAADGPLYPFVRVRLDPGPPAVRAPGVPGGGR